MTKDQKYQLKKLKKYLKDKPHNWTQSAGKMLASGAVYHPETNTFNLYGHTMAFLPSGELDEL